jgi:hypothetical protein
MKLPRRAAFRPGAQPFALALPLVSRRTSALINDQFKTALQRAAEQKIARLKAGSF